MIPTDVYLDWLEQKKVFTWAWIGYNANTEEWFVSILPKSWSHSLLIIEN